MSSNRYMRLIPLGKNGSALIWPAGTVLDDGPTYSFGMQDFNEVSGTIIIDRAAATAVLVYLDVSDVDGVPASTDWIPFQSEAVVAGVATLSDLYKTKTVAGDDSFSFRFSGVNHRWGRLRLGDTAATSDTITGYAHGAFVG